MDDYPRSRDPLDVLIYREAKTCKGCKHELDATAWGQSVKVCQLRQKYGNRCKRYEEKGNT